MRYYIIAGEASGDLHAANLMKEIKKQDPYAEFRYWGGDLMQQQGGTPVKHYKELAFMGFVEVLLNLKTIVKNIKFCKKDIEQWNPDKLILVDYPGFNLRIAPFAKKKGIEVIYYISPQIWAWKASRVHKIKRYVDEMLVILPFEKKFYKKYGMEVHFVGHPLIDAIEQKEEFDEHAFRKKWSLSQKPIIALLPGSRKQEIQSKLPIMLSMAKRFPDYQFVVAGAPGQEKEFYNKYIDERVKLVENQTYSLLKISTAALVASGTATLETALLNVPQIVCYKGSRISYEIGKRLIKHIDFISLVNLIMGKEVVRELIQEDLTTENIVKELNKILKGEGREQMLVAYQDLRQRLGGMGASKKAAEIICK